ncbi:hypothetical protein ACRYCC_11955 [Actinomadura scrupuli]|uniref:hypothetical protein n=1 Tax=Actinomadura scrupuli TaxID=559629 RepID=UPI003D977646
MTEQVRDLPINAVRLAMFGVGRALLLSDRLTKDYKEIKESGMAPVLGRWRNDAEQAAVKVIDRVVERVTGAEEPEAETPVARPPRKVNNSLAAEPELALGKPAPRPGKVTELAPEPVVEPESEPVVIAVVEPALEPVLEPEAVPEPAPRPAPKTVPKPAPEPVTAKPEAKPAAKPASKPAAKPAAKPVAAEPAAKPATAAKPKAKPRAKAAAKAPKSEPVAADALPMPNYDELTLASVRARLRSLNIEQVSLLRDYERANAARADFLRMFANRITKLEERA